MKRGDLVTVAMQGDFGKPRPALVIQSDQFAAIGSVTVLLLSSALVDAPLIRIDVSPSRMTGLHKTSQVMIDKTMTVRSDKIGDTFGHLDDQTMVAINRSLALFLGFG